MISLICFFSVKTFGVKMYYITFNKITYNKLIKREPSMLNK